MKTLAAILVHLGKPLEIREIEIPPLKKGQVLVQMAFAGLCHTQLNEWKGTKGLDPYLPHTLGHEGSGTVLEVGEGVEKVKPGDAVVLSWIKGTGMDVANTSYMCNNTIINCGAISTFLNKTIVSENRIIPISKKIPLREAALLGCAIPTGAGVVLNDMQVKEGQSIAVFGIGGIGQSAILAAKYVKAYPIIAVDIHQEKLDRAIRLGATHTIHAAEENPQIRISQLFKDVDFALESAGRREVMEMAFNVIRPFGGQCVLAGNLPKGEKIQIDPFDLIKGKKIIGTWGGSSQIDKDVQFYAENFIKEQNLLTPMISHEVPLEQINELMMLLDKGVIARGLIHF